MVGEGGFGHFDGEFVAGEFLIGNEGLHDADAARVGEGLHDLGERHCG